MTSILDTVHLRTKYEVSSFFRSEGRSGPFLKWVS